MHLNGTFFKLASAYQENVYCDFVKELNTSITVTALKAKVPPRSILWDSLAGFI